MSECACLYGDYDGDTAEFYAHKWVVARKEHRCLECLRPIAKGERYYRVVGKWEGDVITNRFCAVCNDVAESLYCRGERVFGTLWEDVEEQIFSEGALNSACLDKLATPEGKQYLSQRWWDWVQERTP